MSKHCQPATKMGARFAARKTIADVTRAVLIALNCIYGIHVATGFINTQSPRSTSARVISKNQPTPFVPIAGKWNFEMDFHQSHSSLLPLPNNARTLCNRTGSDGIVQMEIVNLITSQKQLLEYWRSKGWEVRPSPHQRPGGIAHFCTRRDEFVYAWSAGKLGRIESLMLVNSTAHNANETTQSIRNKQ